MVSIVAMLPELNVGVVVLTNQENTSAFESIAYTVLDHYLDAAGKDWVAAYAAVDKRRVEVAEKMGTDAAGKRDAASKQSLPQDAYVGRYATLGMATSSSKSKPMGLASGSSTRPC